MFPTAVLISRDPLTFETRRALTACLLNDIAVYRKNIDELNPYRDTLAAGLTMPIGSVEYVRESMAAAEVKEPENLSYHPCVKGFLGRSLELRLAGDFLSTNHPLPIFVKPMATKAFTGFVYRPGQADENYSPHDLEQLGCLRELPKHDALWTSPVVAFTSEWRYYVMDGKTIGSGRYDSDGEDNAPAPGNEFVKQVCHATWQALKHPFALDIGVLQDSGNAAVVELNDAWAIGLYADGAEAKKLSDGDYLKFLFARWKSLFKLEPT